MSMKRTVEILAPAGSKESLVAAVSAGADAVYIGGNRFGARAYAENLSEEELLEAIDYVHLHGRKIYLTVNTLLKDGELAELYDYLLPYYERGLDAVIVQDVGVMEYIHKCFPDLSLHVSTQATVTGAYGAEFFKKMGAERIVPAREINLEEVRKMKQETGLEIECFVHGALCYCYSGQCLLSSMIGGRSGNRGQCAQPCRLPYSVKGEKKQDILSLKDLCTIEMIPELIEAGIDSFKIEGRMKQPDYVYTVVSMYRKYADLYLNHGKQKFYVSKEDKKKLENVFRRRGYTDGYYKRQNGKEMISMKRPTEGADESISTYDTKIKEKFNGKLILFKEESAKLYLDYGDLTVACEGAIVQKAKNQPLGKDRVEKQMRKTGATEFLLDKLEIDMEDDIFLPMQALNELRRDALMLLEDKILSAYRKTSARKIETEIEAGQKGEDQKRTDNALSVLVSNQMQLEKVLGDFRINTIYAEAELLFENSDQNFLSKCPKNQKLIVAMPYIFREKAISIYEKWYEKITQADGVMIRNWESYEWLKSHGYDGEIRTDYNMYAFNRWSKKVLANAGCSRFCAPCELNYRELKDLGIQDGVLIGYGYQPVMITANCVRKNTEGCSHKEGILYLTDRYQKKFAVKNCCRYCYNIIYNCQPLMLLSQQEEINSLNPFEIRMDFLSESLKEMDMIIGLYDACFKNGQNVEEPDIDFTRGHFKRGVK